MFMAIIIYLIGGLIFGSAARRVSEYRAEPDGFWWGFWLGGIGLLIVIFRRSAVEEVHTAPPGSSARQSWLCSQCGARNPAGREQCQSCSAMRDAPNPTRNCPACGAKNKALNANCFACGHSFEN